MSNDVKLNAIVYPTRSLFGELCYVLFEGLWHHRLGLQQILGAHVAALQSETQAHALQDLKLTPN